METYKSVYDTICGRRTIRKFLQRPIERHILEKLIDAARLAPSAANLQPLKYCLVTESNEVRIVFEHVKWAAYIRPHGTPLPGEEPVAYILVLVDTDIRKTGYELDVGAAVQNLLLTAEAEDIGTCWMAAIDRDKICSALHIDGKYILNTAIALGYKAENPQVKDMHGDVQYYKDENGVLHVPKRKIHDIIL